MANPSLPQHDDSSHSAARARELAWARTQYTWAHSHTYPDGQVLEPIAVLEVDDTHPLPRSQTLNLVQLLELLTVGLDVLGNVVVCLTNLLDIGAVELDPPPPKSFGASADEHGKGLLGKVRDAAESLVDSAVDKAKQVIEDAERARADAKDVKALLAKLETHRARGDELAQKARIGLSLNPRDGGLLDELGKGIGELFENVLETLLEDAAEAILSAVGLWGRAPNLDAFARQFQTLVVPNDVATTMTDTSFADMRVAGPNPLLIRKIDALPSNFPVDARRFEALTGQALDAALASSRVYLVDYAALADVGAGDIPAGQKYLSAPLSLFVLGEDRQTLQPVAIQCQQTPGNSNPVFYCDDGQSWELAKFHVQSADGNYHELISHLGLTHMLIEPFVVATHRNLAQQHPLLLLLLPHFQGTLFINNAAITSLIAPGGAVDKLLAGTIAADWGVTATALTQLDFNAHMLPHDLAARGVADAELLPGYPYRDDALLVWAAILAWVRDYLSLYYNTDADVVGDTELQAWFQDLVSPAGGCVKGLGEPGPDGGVGLFTFTYLVEVVTMVIFTGSAQHATVNFPQLSIMSYTPAMPLAMYAPAPTMVSGALAGDALLMALPPLQMGLLQLLVGQLLGGVYFTRLGQYDRHQRGDWFSDARVVEPLAAFQNNLAAVERTIGARNLERPSYDPLLPSRIPQSINI